jgi:hypothetical protein
VLLGERFRRRHQGGLLAGLERAQHRVDRDDRLAAPHLPHQQPLHGPSRGEVGVDLGACIALSGRELEGKRVEPAVNQLAWLSDLDARSRIAARAPAYRQRRLVEAELLEREPAPREVGLVLGVGEVRGA